MISHLNGNSKKLIVHCCYHKVGTAWFGRILSSIAREFGWFFQECEHKDLKPETAIFLQHHSAVDFSMLPPYVGSHLIRDPRDVVVSRYFYHLWCREEWCTKKKYWIFGESYQSRLNKLSVSEGIALEIRKIQRMMKNLANWNFDDPQIMELRYEELIFDDRRGFAALLKHYGFDEEMVEKSMPIVERFSFEKMTNRALGQESKTAHLRKGLPGDWKNYFTNEHKQLFEKLYPGALCHLGYEDNGTW